MTRRTQLAMVLMGYVPLLHAGGAIAWAILLPGMLKLASIAWLLVLPPVVVRASQLVRPMQPRATFGSGGFLRWWWQSQWQVVFNRLPWIEETIRLWPGLYSLWLRLWGAKVGRFV